MTPSPVRIGQVYRDCDRRSISEPRYVRVVDTRFPFAGCERVWWHARHREWAASSRAPTRIRLDRLTSSRFELVEDVTK